MSLEETLETGLLERGVRTQVFDLSTPLTQNCWKRAWAAACWMSSVGTKRKDFMVVESLGGKESCSEGRAEGEDFEESSKAGMSCSWRHELILLEP